MKKHLLIVIALVALIGFKADVKAQTGYNTAVEYFTGTWCQWCPCSHAIIENILPTVVAITASKNMSYSDEFYENSTDSLQSIGSGFIISDDGYIITNNHVVDGAEKINIRLKGSDSDFAAEVIGVDEVVDIALLKITLKNNKLPFAEFDSTDSQKVGDFVFVAGNPYNFRFHPSVHTLYMSYYFLLF